MSTIAQTLEVCRGFIDGRFGTEYGEQVRAMIDRVLARPGISGEVLYRPALERTATGWSAEMEQSAEGEWVHKSAVEYCVANVQRRDIERVIWEAAIRCAADEADRAAGAAMSEEQRLAMLRTPRVRSAIAQRILALTMYDPPKSEMLGAP